MNLNKYQKQCRVYLDEYSEQKEKRCSWLGKRDNYKFYKFVKEYINDLKVMNFMIKRFMVRK